MISNELVGILKPNLHGYNTGPHSTVGSQAGKFDPGPVPYTFVEIDNEIISRVILLLLN